MVLAERDVVLPQSTGALCEPRVEGETVTGVRHVEFEQIAQELEPPLLSRSEGTWLVRSAARGFCMLVYGVSIARVASDAAEQW